MLNCDVRQHCEDWAAITQPARVTVTICNLAANAPNSYVMALWVPFTSIDMLPTLCATGRYLLYHHGYETMYSGQSEAVYDRMLHGANKLRMELGLQLGTGHFISSKSKVVW